MNTRIRPQIARPWIKRPREIAAVVATILLLAASPAYAQRGGGCAGMSGGTGGTSGTGGTGSLGAGGGLGGIGGGNQVQRSIAVQQQMQALYGIPSFGGGEEAFDRQQYLAERRAFRAAQAEQRKARLAFRKERPSKQLASRKRSANDT